MTMALQEDSFKVALQEDTFKVITDNETPKCDSTCESNEEDEEDDRPGMSGITILRQVLVEEA